VSLGLQRAEGYNEGSFQLVSAPPTTQAGRKPMGIDYLVSEALEIELGLDTRITSSVAAAVERAIVRLLTTFKNGLQMKSVSSAGYVATSHPINGYFGNSALAVRNECWRFGISKENFDVGWATRSNRSQSWTGTVTQAHGLEYLDEKQALELWEICGAHGARKELSIKISNCLCCRIGALIQGFATTMAALIQCQYNPDGLRLQADIVNGSRTTPWNRTTIISGSRKTDGFLTSSELFQHLSQLVHGLEAIKEIEIINQSPGTEILAVSIDSISVYYRALLDAECFDKHGKMLAISSGRLSSKGVLRYLVKEHSTPTYGLTPEDPIGHCSEIAEGFNVVPNYAKGPVEVSMDITVAEDEFWVQTLVFHSETRFTAPVELAKSIHNALSAPIGSTACSHDAQKPFTIHLSKEPAYLATFLGSLGNTGGLGTHFKGIYFYTLKDCQIEQLLQAGILANAILFQGDSCLHCCVDRISARRGSASFWEAIIMT